MRQRNVRYLSRMIVKTAVILLPILITFFAVFTYKTAETTWVTHLSNFCGDFYSLEINAWYRSFIGIFSLDTLISENIGTILLSLPLYFIWVEIFDLLLHLIFFFTDLFHKFLGGEK